MSFNAAAGRVSGSGADDTGDVPMISADAGGVAGPGKYITAAGAGPGGGEGGTALTDTGLRTGTRISTCGSVRGARIGVIHGTSEVCHETSRE